MLSLEPSTLGNHCDVNALKFWHLRINKNYDKPEYYIGQTVLHRIKVSQGEILHPVTIFGVLWTGIDWEYAVQFPENHPHFQPEDSEWDWLDDWQIEAM